MARSIFFSRNRFCMGPWPFETPDYRLSLLDFLGDPLQNLRSIRFNFPELNRDLLLPGQSGTVGWDRTITLISQSIPLSVLTLVIDLTGDVFFNPRTPEQDDQRDADKWTVNQRAVRPLVRLSGLKDLFIHIAYPRGDENLHIRSHQEQLLEQMVMGDGYNSSSRGKTPLI
ncbi:hypothetical protein AJ80_08588 [Polytolypa hystricis UAMH7299]|uniref:Uncharacterized protein n=1 Tax=Polytolypa hystricis (strain UAMH7299) TaxID=1447883 RepID=A0A2B7WXA3_POLH7|nr:hypothetical protein AJ80_08588 [Polytolypa hystricis UAMH7299]